MRLKYRLLKGLLLLLCIACSSGPAWAQTNTPTLTPTHTPTVTHTPLPTYTSAPVPRNEGITMWRQQPACKPFALPAGEAQSVCVEWPIPNVAVALGTLGSDYQATCSVTDLTDMPSGSTAVLMPLSKTQQLSTGLCLRVFNRDASSEHIGELCCQGLQWGSTQ